jgi:predicted thioesterase
MGERQAELVAEALATALRNAASSAPGGAAAGALEEAAATVSASRTDRRPADAALPEVGSTVTRTMPVTDRDTASAMGHPDPAMGVLGSPTLSLWFELVSSALLPVPAPELTHVGSGILVHHLAPARVGEQVSVVATTAATVGRRVNFTCTAYVGRRLVAIGAHQRVLRPSG